MPNCGGSSDHKLGDDHVQVGNHQLVWAHGHGGSQENLTSSFEHQPNVYSFLLDADDLSALPGHSVAAHAGGRCARCGSRHHRVPMMPAPSEPPSMRATLPPHRPFAPYWAVVHLLHQQRHSGHSRGLADGVVDRLILPHRAGVAA